MKRCLLFPLLAILPVFAVRAATLPEPRIPDPVAPWPMFMHDPQHTGRTTIVALMPPEKYWAKPLGPVVSAGAVVTEEGDYIAGSFAGSVDGYSSRGYRKWSVDTGGEVDMPAVLLPGGTAVFGAADGTVYAVSGDGELVWSFATEGGFRRAAPVFDAARDHIYIGSLDCSLYCLDSGGDLRWRFETGGPIWSAPALLPASGRVVFGSDDGHLRALEPGSAVVFDVDLGAPIRSAPAISADRIVVATTAGDLVSLDFEGTETWRLALGATVDGSSPAIDEQGWIFIGSGAGFHGISPQGQLEWSYQNGFAFRSPPAIDGRGRIIAGCDDKNLYGFRSDGRMLWAVPLDGLILSPPAIDLEGRIVIGCLDGQLRSFEQGVATPTVTPEPTWTPVPPPSATPTSSPTPLARPYFRLAGFMGSDVSTAGGTLDLFAWAADPYGGTITDVEVYYGGQPTGLHLPPCPGLENAFWLQRVEVGAGLIEGYYPIELVATSEAGTRSDLWPGLTISPPAGAGAGRHPGKITPELTQLLARRSMTAGDGRQPTILCAGFMDTHLIAGQQCELLIIAAVTDPQGVGDIAEVELCYQLEPTGLLLRDDGRSGDAFAGDGLFTYRTEAMIPATAAGEYVFELVARDRAGNRSNPWPYLAVVAGSEEE